MSAQAFKERIASQIPAIKLLVNCGYEYIAPDVCLAERITTDNVLLRETLKKSLSKINSFQHNNESLPIPENLLDEAIKELSDWNNHNLRDDNKNLHNHLIEGKGLTFTFEGVKKSAHLYFFDFKNIENNTFQVTEEFSVQRTGLTTNYIPDIVILVNGIPLASIECKKPGLPDAISKGIAQHIRNQNHEAKGITKFYNFQQILGSMAGSTGAKYGSIGTPEEFWAQWKEDKYSSKEDKLKSLVNTDIDANVKNAIFGFRHSNDRKVMDSIWSAGDREVTAQDQLLYFVFRPDRLMDIFSNFIIYKDLEKIAPRHQQYFAVKEALKRVKNFKDDGSREGGVIWHTTGSGKSYTMVMLAKALSADKSIEHPRIVVVTDRKDLDKQIFGTFKRSGESVKKAKSGSELCDLIENKDYKVLTTIIDKFDTVGKTRKVSDDDSNIFVLVDEGHRSQFGETHSLMRNAFKNAAFIAFTGTPIRRVKKDLEVAQATETQFGEFIHKYTMENALDDEAVCPIVYEGRMGELTGDQEKLDRWFDRVTKDLNDDQKAALKKRFNTEQEVLKADDRIRAVALDIKNHYRENFSAEGEPTKDFMKGQLATNSKEEAMAYKKYLEEFGMKVELVISSPDMREGAKTIDEDNRPEIIKFWDDAMTRYGGANKYVETVVSNFKDQDEPEILIVVDMLLTGFDAPRNAVLYIDKRLREHNVLQAIARVNRLYPRKSEGLVIDYRGIFEDMNDAIDFYRKMEGADFDSEDIKGSLFAKKDEVAKLDGILKALKDHFKDISNMTDDEEIGRYLADENLRKDFYQKFRDYHNVYKLALGYADWVYDTSEQDKKKYKDEYKFFADLRTIIKERYPEGINYKDYVDDIRRLVDVNLKSDPPRIIVEKFHIFDREDFEKKTKDKSAGSKGDIIRGLMESHISEHFDEDPIFYKKLSEIIADTYEKYRDRRITEAEFLEILEVNRSKIEVDIESDLPEAIAKNMTTRGYYRVVESIKNKIPNLATESISNFATVVDEIVKKHAVKDWQLGNVVERRIISSIYSDVFYPLEDEYKVEFSDDEMNVIIEDFIRIAKRLDYR